MSLYHEYHTVSRSPVDHLAIGKPQEFFSSPHYIGESRQYKMDSLWSEIEKDKSHSTWPTFDELKGVQAAPLEIVFDSPGDALQVVNG